VSASESYAAIFNAWRPCYQGSGWSLRSSKAATRSLEAGFPKKDLPICLHQGHQGANGARLYKTQMDFFCRDDDLAWLPFGDEYGWSGSGKIALCRIRETVLVQASKGAALAPCREDRPSFDSPIQNMIPSSWEVHASCTRHIASSYKNTRRRCSYISGTSCFV
jgi:hypothetical protein